MLVSWLYFQPEIGVFTVDNQDALELYNRRFRNKQYHDLKLAYCKFQDVDENSTKASDFMNHVTDAALEICGYRWDYFGLTAMAKVYHSIFDPAAGGMGPFIDLQLAVSHYFEYFLNDIPF
jgi:hypothetical protein